MRIGAKNVVKIIANGLFPPRCRGCGERGEYVCGCCKKYISENMKAREICEAGADAAYFGFRDEILGELIEEAKYYSVRGMLSDIAEVIFEGYFRGLGKVVLVPMPTSRKHVRERAMDHMDLICREVARLSGGKIRCVRMLVRAKDTVQVGASREVRRKQAKEAVRVNPKYLEEDGRILKKFRRARVVLVDDVWTTGASMMEAGRKLEEVGVSRLHRVAITKNRAKRSPTLRRGEII